MEKAIILVDSSCDISIEHEARLGNVKVVNLNVEMGGQSYKDRVDVCCADVYNYVKESGQLPHTSQVTVMEFIEEYAALAAAGYTEIICTCINSKGSSTYNSSLLAKNMFFEEYPQYQGKVTIHNVDTLSYAIAIGWVVLMGSDMLKAGKSAAEVAEFMADYYRRQTTMLGVYSLDYAKKSGRLNSTAAFVGEVLGLKPIMSIWGENKVIDKVRGDKAVATRMAQIYQETALDVAGDYVIAYGEDFAVAEELEKALMALGAKKAFGKYPIGTCIAINSGPRMLGLVYLKKQ